jgi:hypothetical protein
VLPESATNTSSATKRALSMHGRIFSISSLHGMSTVNGRLMKTPLPASGLQTTNDTPRTDGFLTRPLGQSVSLGSADLVASLNDFADYGIREDQSEKKG